MRILAMTGAGASVCAGAPTYRGPGGLYDKDNIYIPETLLRAEMLKTHPDKILSALNFLTEKLSGMEPGYTHLELAALEQHHEVMVVTQNVDGLHSKAGSGRVVELHGNIDRLVEREGHLVPDIVLFGDPIDPFELARVLDFTSKPVDALIVVGTTLQFEYLWSIVYKCRMYGAKLYLIDADEDHEYKDQFHYYYKPVESLITRLFINYQE